MYVIRNQRTNEHLDSGSTREQVKRALQRLDIDLVGALPRKGRALYIVQPLYAEQAGKPSVVITVV